METGGLYYSVVAPAEAVVGTPSTFPLEIELIDSNTGDRVVSHTGLVSVEVFAAGTGDPGAGVLGTIQQTLVDGYALVQQTYTRAEDVYFVVSDADENTGVSNTCRMLADGFKQVMIIAPGCPIKGAICMAHCSGARLPDPTSTSLTKSGVPWLRALWNASSSGASTAIWSQTG